jgi:hypothetical protein
MNSSTSNPIDRLELADPGLAARVAARLSRKPAPPEPALLELLVSETLWALGVEISFGLAAADGYGELIGEVAPARLEVFRHRLRAAGRVGPIQGRILAECLPLVLIHGREEFLSRFDTLWEVLARKGSFTLSEPLRALGQLLAAGDHASAAGLVDLMLNAFAAELSYDQSRHLSTALPKAVFGFKPEHRAWQIDSLRRVVRESPRLADAFFSGFGQGLARLSPGALEQFVGEALRAWRRSGDAGRRFLALESKAAQERVARLQVSVGLERVKDGLERYLRARTGLPLAVRPLSALPAAASGRLAEDTRVCSDEHAVYLPEEIGSHAARSDNLRLYKLLLRLQVSFHEFGTFDFDLEKAAARCGRDAPCRAGGSAPEPDGSCDLARFTGAFPDPSLAADLFTIFELGRIRKRLERQYPGIARSSYAALQEEAVRRAGSTPAAPLLDRLMMHLSLGRAECGGAGLTAAASGLCAAVAAAFEAAVTAASPVEASAELTWRFYDAIAALQGPAAEAPSVSSGAGRLSAPFGWRPWPIPAGCSGSPYERQAGRIKSSLARLGLHAFKSDIRRRLALNSGTLARNDICELCACTADMAAQLEPILATPEPAAWRPGGDPADHEPGYRYPEWDMQLADYLQRHVLLRERSVPGRDGGFYADVLKRRRGLVSRTRQAFERMRPEGLKRLRKWLDGDEFDYRQLIDWFVDRRSGGIPSERLYIKRLKEQRDVAVLLLVDASRSTAQAAAASGRPVIDILKEAVVVLSEALAVLGDAFSIAGFSGTGRLGVDYFRLKSFDEPMSAEVKARIGALTPQRNTRMGAAVRHAGRQLEAVPARVRLLIVLSDGFPSDRDYPRPYGVADTRQALMELRARRIQVHTLTVTLPADPKLDELYGRVGHQVISDVAELPDKLVRTYGALTRA